MTAGTTVTELVYRHQFVSSSPPFLIEPVLNGPGYIVSSGADTRLRLAPLDLINAMACIG